MATSIEQHRYPLFGNPAMGTGGIFQLPQVVMFRARAEGLFSRWDHDEIAFTVRRQAEQMKYVLDKEKQEAERKRIEAQGIADYQTIINQGLNDNLLKWKGIEATRELARSQNAKVVVIGAGKEGLPIILGNP